MPTLNVKVRAQILIPTKNLDPYDVEMLKETTTWHRYLDPYQCKQCEYRPERPVECNGCEFYEKHQFHETQIDMKTGKPYLVIRRGYLPMLKSLYQDDLVVKDLQTYTPMAEQRYKFDMTMLSDKQTEAVNTLVEALEQGTSGYLKSPPRTGKTVMACAIALTLKRKTIIIAHQEDLLIGKGQLITTFTEPTAKNAPINPGRHFTNLHKFIAKGKTPIKFCRTLKDFQETDICLVTYQMFLHPRGKKLLSQIKSMFGLMIVDECFPAGTMVTLSDGTEELIEVIAENPTNYKVKSFNTDTNVVESNSVISANKKEVNCSMITLHYPGGSLTCTDNHPIWSHTRGSYIRADEIQEGEDVELLDT
jgi:hypothetical protein